MTQPFSLARVDHRRLRKDLTEKPRLVEHHEYPTAFGELSPYSPPRTERTYNVVRDLTGSEGLATAASLADAGGAALDLGEQAAAAAQEGRYGAATGLGALGLASVLPVPAAKVTQGASALGKLLRRLSPAPPTSFPNATLASTRFPTAKGAAADPVSTPVMSGDLDEFVAGKTAEQNMGLMSEYPGFSFLRGMDPPEAADAAANRIADNLEFLHGAAPRIMQDRSPRWYEGAGRFSESLANRYGVPRQNASAAIAALSPQKDWFQNASMAERVGDALFTKQNEAWTPQMSATMREIFPPKDTRVGRLNQDLVRRIEGKKLAELKDPTEQAMWIRVYDTAHNPRHHRSMTPEGDLGDFVMIGDGSRPRKTAWGSLGEIGKAVRAFQSDGSMAQLSPLLGSRHKVRNFYNNIENPDMPWGVTADTHQVAAGTMMPLAGNDAAVMHNLATSPTSAAKRPENWQSAANTSVTGFQGTYPVFEEGTRRASERIGLLPHKTQSVTWEPVRELFDENWKTDANKQAVANIWREVDAGNLSPEQARNAIVEYAGGIGRPQWEGSSTLLDPRTASTYR